MSRDENTKFLLMAFRWALNPKLWRKSAEWNAVEDAIRAVRMEEQAEADARVTAERTKIMQEVGEAVLLSRALHSSACRDRLTDHHAECTCGAGEKQHRGRAYLDAFASAAVIENKQTKVD